MVRVRQGEEMSAETVTITADILVRSDHAVPISDGDWWAWLPKSQIEHQGEVGDTAVAIKMPKWLAWGKGLI